MRDLHALSSHALMASLVELCTLERRTTTDVVLHLVEIQRRKIHVDAGYSSMFLFCRDRLKYPKGSAYRLSRAAELVGRWPVIVDYLLDGRLSTTTLCGLKDVLTDGSMPAILDRAAGKTEDEIEAFVAALAPRPAQRDLFTSVSGSSPEPRPASAPEPTPGAAPAPAAAALAAPKSTVEVRAPELHRMHLTVTTACVEDLRAVAALLSHKLPGADMGVVVAECIRLAREHFEKPRRPSRPRAARPTSPGSRHIPAALEREVWVRDGAACTFVGPDGHRCGSTHFVEVHHIIPFARGGPTTAENLTLRCRAHNLRAAEQDFGAAFMRGAIGAARGGRVARPDEP